MIYYKTERQRSEFKLLDIRLQFIFWSVASVAYERKKYHTIVTECIRTKQEDEQYGGVGIHVIRRALDFNFCKDETDEGRIIDKEFTEWICDFVNNYIPYGYGKFKTILFHTVGAGKHFHLQVSRKIKTTIFNTLKKKDFE